MVGTGSAVIRARSPRQGVLVIKSGKLRNVASDFTDQSVVLVREFQGDISGSCSHSPPKFKGSVAIRSYEDFHDLGLRVDPAEAKTLDDFHIRYRSSRGRCVSTADSTNDGVLSFDGRSNRSQFSFDDEIVSKGMRSQILSQLLPRATLASSSSYSKMRVEIAEYDTGVSELTCVRFSIPRVGPEFFIRIVDLEARDLRPPFPRQNESV